MRTEIDILRAEVAALRGEVRRKRKHGRLIPIAILALFVALIPGLAIAANPFNDLVPNSPHNGNIDAIYNAGITTGCVPNQSYCPTDLVTRQEMASFLARTAGLANNPPVANAKTAQNAALLQGFQANGLVRTNLGYGGSSSIVVGTAIQVLTGIDIQVPGPGFVLVMGAGTFSPTSTPANLFATVRLRDVSGGVASPPLGSEIGTVAGSALLQQWLQCGSSRSPRQAREVLSSKLLSRADRRGRPTRPMLP